MTMKSKTWIYTLFIILGSIALFLGMFNYAVDPYGYFSRQDKYIKNLTRISKPEILNIKLYTDASMYLIGTSRQRRINPQLIEKLTGKKTQNVNITGATLSENMLLAKKIKQLGKHFIFGFDATSLNHYRVTQFPEIQDRYHSYKKALEKKQNAYASLFHADIAQLSIQHIIDRYKHIDYAQIEKHENAHHYIIDPKVLLGAVDGSNKKSSYSSYQAYSDAAIISLAKIATKDDVFVILPKYLGWYKMFHSHQDIEKKYFHAISILVKHTQAKVWIFYGDNSITRNAKNFDTNGWHFKPYVAKLIFSKVYTSTSESVPKDFGYLLTVENVDGTLNAIGDND